MCTKEYFALGQHVGGTTTQPCALSNRSPDEVVREFIATPIGHAMFSLGHRKATRGARTVSAMTHSRPLP
jgi:hypothetical protein